MNRDAQVKYSGVAFITDFLQLSAAHGMEDELIWQGCTEYFVLPYNSRIRKALKFSGLFGVRENPLFVALPRNEWIGGNA